MFLSTQTVAVAAPPNTQLQVTLLGTPGTSWLGQPLPLARRQARALLFRVASAQQPVSRDQLCFLLWPDQPDAVARRNLSVLLDQLRRALPAPDVLLKTGDTVALNPQLAWADTTAFVQQSSAALGAGQFDRLAGTTELYRGPFLDGFVLPGSAEFDDWASAERQQWELRYLQALTALVDAHTTRGEHAAAVHAVQRYLAVDAVAEDMHRRAIGLYALMGERGAALRQYERCVVALERELGVDPLPETRAVYEAVRDGLSPLQALPVPQREPDGAVQVLPAAQPAPPTARPLPVPLSPMLGRADELGAARAQLSGRARLLTLCGPGGSGKTRLALAVAAEARDQYADGVVWVPLAPLRSAEQVAEAIIQACGMQPAGADDPAAVLRAYLRDKHMLLVLDNIEHLLPAAALLADLLAAAPRLQLLATSRSVLNLYGEHVLPVRPLPLPDLQQLPPPAELAEQPAVALLLARARANNDTVRLSAENAAELAAICVQLDGLPLAIELAAARLRLLSPRDLLKRLDRRLTLLEGGPRDLPERQQTLRATIEWSYRLLGHDEGQLLEYLAVFAGGWTLDAVEELSQSLETCPRVMLDGLQALLDANLIVRQDRPDEEPRFGMLETIREYALERLQQRGRFADSALAHARYFARLVEQVAPGLCGPDQARLLMLLDAEHANLKLALETFRVRGEVERGLRLASALERFWRARGYFHEGQRWIEHLLALRPAGATEVPAPIVARAHVVACSLANYRSDVPAARAHGEAAVELQRATGQTRELALMLVKLVGIYKVLEDRAAAELALAEATTLAETLADADVNAALARIEITKAAHRGDIAQARAGYESILLLWRERGDLLLQVTDLGNLANISLALDDTASAEGYATEMLELSIALASQAQRAMALYTLGEIARYLRDLPRAERHYSECYPLMETAGRREWAAYTLHNLGVVALDRGNIAKGRALILQSRQHLPEYMRNDTALHTLEALGRVAAAQGRPLRAARLWGAAEEQAERSGFVRLPIDQQELDHYIALARAGSPAPAFEAAWRAGRHLSIEHALAEEARDNMAPARLANAA